MSLLTFFAVALFAATHAGAQAPAGRPKTERFKGREVVAGQVLVKFSTSASPQEIERARGAADIEHERGVGGRGVRLFQSRSKDAETLVRELSARPDVVYAEPNYVIRLTAAPDDPRFGEQWALRNTGTPGADVGAVGAWDISTGSRDNVVAVVDTGIDYRHTDLAANVWSAPAPFTVNIAGQAINCAAGTHGFDALTNTCDPLDDNNHGTHAAGIAGAVGNNGVGVSGVSQTASIMGLRFLDATGTGTLEGAVNAIEFAIQAKQIFGAGANVRVLSNSWGWAGGASQALLEQINRAAESDMLFVAGAGNAGTDNDTAPFYPASYDAASVVSVAATDSNDALARTSSWGSNYGRNSVDLGAPGNLVLSTVIGGSYDWFSGTSMATPHVSGAAALVLSRCPLDTAGLKSTLLGNVDQVASLSGVTATGGRLDVGKALSSCATAAPTPSPTPTPAPNVAPTVALTAPADGTKFTAPANITLSANASDADGAISRVDFYAGTQLVGTAYAPPYAYAWGNVAAGTYQLTAVAADDRGGAATSAPVSILVNRPPTANPGGSYSGQAGRLVQFYGGGSTDADGTIVSYRWEFGDGTTGEGALPVHTYASAGTYVVRLTVLDDNGASSVAKTTATISAPPASGTAGRLSKWIDNAGTLGDSTISEANGNLVVNGGNIQMTATPSTSRDSNVLFMDNNNKTAGFIASQTPAFLAANGPYLAMRGNTYSLIPGQRGLLSFSAGNVPSPVGKEGSVLFLTGPDQLRMSIKPSGNVGIGTDNPRSTLQVNGYVQLALTSGAPPAADCDEAAEHGRMKVDAIGVRIYVCTAAGWKSTALQ